MHRKSQSHSALSTLLPSTSSNSSRSSKPSTTRTLHGGLPLVSRSHRREDASMSSLPGLTEVIGDSIVVVEEEEEGMKAKMTAAVIAASASATTTTKSRSPSLEGLRRSATSLHISKQEVVSSRNSKVDTTRPSSSTRNGLKRSSTITSISRRTRNEEEKDVPFVQTLPPTPSHSSTMIWNQPRSHPPTISNPTLRNPSEQAADDHDEERRRRRRRGERKEEDLESRLRKIASIRTSHGTRIKILSLLEKEFKSIAPRSRDEVIGEKMMRFLSMDVHVPLLHLLNRNVSVILTLSHPSSRDIINALLDQVSILLNLFQGLSFLDNRKEGCAAALGEEFVIEALLDLLYHLSTTTPLFSQSTTTSIQIQLIDLLYPILLSSPTHVRRFSTADGMSTIQSLVVGDGGGDGDDEGRREVKLKCVEFLIFWDMLTLEEGKRRRGRGRKEGQQEEGEEEQEEQEQEEERGTESPREDVKHTRRSPIGSSAMTSSTSSMLTSSSSVTIGLPNGDRVSSGGSTTTTSTTSSSSSSSLSARRSSITSSSSIILRTPIIVDDGGRLPPRTPRKDRHSIAPTGLGFLTPQTNRTTHGLPGRQFFADDQALLGRSIRDRQSHSRRAVAASTAAAPSSSSSSSSSSFPLGAVIEEQPATHESFGQDLDDSMHSTFKEDQTPRRRTPSIHVKGKSFGALAVASGIGLGLPRAGKTTEGETMKSTAARTNGGMTKSATSMGLSGMTAL